MKKAVMKKEISRKKLEEMSESMVMRIINGSIQKALSWPNGRG